MKGLILWRSPNNSVRYLKIKGKNHATRVRYCSHSLIEVIKFSRIPIYLFVRTWTGKEVWSWTETTTKTSSGGGRGRPPKFSYAIGPIPNTSTFTFSGKRKKKTELIN